jgi:hypothetical protein
MTYDLQLFLWDFAVLLLEFMPRRCLQIRKAVRMKNKKFTRNMIPCVWKPKSLMGEEHLRWASA